MAVGLSPKKAKLQIITLGAAQIAAFVCSCALARCFCVSVIIISRV